MNRQFGALSGLAIVLVVLNHSIHMGMTFLPTLGYPAVEGWGRYVLEVLQQLGVFAVPTFLFISGCFATYALQSGSLRQSYKTMWSRLQHILWPYLIWSIVFYELLYAHYGQHYTIPEYVKFLLVGYPFNFVPLLVFYYVLSPLLVRLGKRYGLLLILGVAVYQLFLINIVIPQSLGFAFPYWMQVLVPPVVSTTLADWAIYFPLGIVYSLHAKAILPWLRRFRWAFVAAAALFFVLHVLHFASVIYAPLAGDLAPLALVCVIPLIRRDAIPFVQPLEWVGRMSYGLYLTHLIVADCVLWIIQVTAPQLLRDQLLLEPLLFVLTLSIPLILMYSMSRLPVRAAYRYMFG
jgi:peptidoglycan/LPS O-acetylase OafA/YrhL